LTSEIENYPGFASVSGADLADAMLAQAKRYDVQVIYGTASSVLKSEDIFTVDCGQDKHTAKAVIVASGTHHLNLGIPGESEFTGRGLSYCAVCDGRFFKNRDVVVIGGGNTAVGDAIYLSGLCRKVTLMHRRDTLRADHILVKRLEEHDNIEKILCARPLAVQGEFKVESLTYERIGSGETGTVSADGVFVAIGSAPHTEFVDGIAGVEKTPGGYIVTDSRCRTAVKGLFAAGDVRAKDLRQIATAVSDGAVAGSSAADYLHGID